MLFHSTSGHGKQCNSWLWDGCNDWFTWKNFIAQNIFTFLLFMSILLPMYVFADSTVITSTGTTEISGFGLSGGNPQKYAQDWVATQDGEVGYVDIATMRIGGGSVADSVKISIQSNSGINPDGTDLASGTISQSSLTTSCAVYRIVFTASTTITNGTTYWLVYDRTGAYAAYPNGYSFCGESPAGYSDTRWYDGSSWNTGNNSMYGIIYQADVDGGGSGTSTESVSTTTDSILFQDWILVNGVIIFLLSLMAFGLIFQGYTSKRKPLWS